MTEAASSPKPASDKFGTADLYAIAIAVIWGVNFPVSKSVLEVLDPIVFSSLRYMSGGLLLFAVMAMRGISLRYERRDFLPLAALGFLGITIFQGLWAYGLDLTTAPKAAILVATAPIFGALLAGFMGRWPSALAWLGIFISFAGVGVIINGSITAFKFSGGTLTGDLLMLGGSFVFALYSSLAIKPVQRLGALKVMAFGMVAGALMLTVIALPLLPSQAWSDMTPGLWVGLTYSTVFAAALAFVWLYESVARLGVTRAMVYAYLIPVFAILVSVAAFGADFNLTQGIASLVVLAGLQLTRTN